MEFSIVAVSEIIEEAFKAANHPAAWFPVVEIAVNKQFATKLFQIPDGFR